MAVKIFFIAVILGVQQTCGSQYEQSQQNCGPLELQKANAAFDVFERYIKTETVLRLDINATASPKFESYLETCDKSPSFLKRLEEFTEDVDVRACLKSRVTKYDDVKQQLQFVCKLESESEMVIREFIENGGGRCVEKRKWALLNYCTLTAHSPPASIGKTECEQQSEFQTCMIMAMETCSPPASRLLDSMFKQQPFTTCNRAPSRRADPEFLASGNNNSVNGAPLNNVVAAISAAVVVTIVAAASF